MENIEKFNNILNSFKIAATCRSFKEYKNAQFYDVELKPGTRVRDIQKYSTELALALKSCCNPKISVLSESGIIRLEILKDKLSKVSLMDLGCKSIRPKGDLTCLLGETLDGNPIWVDLSKNPHTLIAGCTGSGKSTILHVIIANLLLYPKIQLYLMDPKTIEFFKYDKPFSNKVSVSFSYQECLDTISFLENEMERRYQIIKSFGYNSIPYIVLIIDEFADLIMQDADKSFYSKLCKLAQKSRAAKIHLILSTQRPSVDIVNGTIKSNFPARISCKVSSHTDSKVILDTTGAQNLIGSGDAIINNYEYNLQRFQAAYISINDVCKYFK